MQKPKQLTATNNAIAIRKLLRCGALCLMIVSSVWESSIGQVSDHRKTVDLAIDAAFQYQKIDGFGLNANTWSWNREFESATDLMLDSLNANIWRVIVETVENWEVKNDNKDPFVYNWKYYNKLYETPKFRKAWDMIAYLNKRGVTDNLMVNFMGRVPLWMGGEVVKPEFEDEYIEMLTSFFIYASREKHLTIPLIAPMNEPDIRKEGPTVKPDQYARLVRKFIDRMHAEGMNQFSIVGPDVAGMENGIRGYIPLMAKDPVIMQALTRFGLHSYAGYYANADSSMQTVDHSRRGYWMTEWNAWCQGCDDGILGEYNYHFAAKSMSFLIDLLNHGAKGAMAWEGYDSYYEHHAPSPFSYWGLLEYDKQQNTYRPRKNFFAYQHFTKFIKPGARRILASSPKDSVRLAAFYDSASRQFTVTGVNAFSSPVDIKGVLTALSGVRALTLYYTDETHNVFAEPRRIVVTDNTFTAPLPARCIFTLSGTVEINHGKSGQRYGYTPEPKGWYTGDIHVHKNCGNNEVIDEAALASMMADNDLAVISLLADMGNGEVLYSEQDLTKVNGADAPQSSAQRIIHWDAEWHWDATYSRFAHQALGGHLVLLGLKEAHQIWAESTATILQWAKAQQGITGICHFQYLNNKFQEDLNCCIPVEYPVEVALGTVDFIAEDVYGRDSPNNGNYNSEAAMQAYYRLLNCGFRLGLAAGTDYPCNNNEPLGTLLTYVNVANQSPTNSVAGQNLTYNDWILGIKNGRTVVSRNGHKEFLDFKVNGKYIPGDELALTKKSIAGIEATWSTTRTTSGTIELLWNGEVIASLHGEASPEKPLTLTATPLLSASGWMAVRRMDDRGHQSHTAPVYVTVAGKPMMPVQTDVTFFVQWIDKLLINTAPGGKWHHYFPLEYEAVRARYESARKVYADMLTGSHKKQK